MRAKGGTARGTPCAKISNSPGAMVADAASMPRSVFVKQLFAGVLFSCTNKRPPIVLQSALHARYSSLRNPQTRARSPHTPRSTRTCVAKTVLTADCLLFVPKQPFIDYNGRRGVARPGMDALSKEVLLLLLPLAVVALLTPPPPPAAPDALPFALWRA